MLIGHLLSVDKHGMKCFYDHSLTTGASMSEVSRIISVEKAQDNLWVEVFRNPFSSSRDVLVKATPAVTAEEVEKLQSEGDIELEASVQSTEGLALKIGKEEIGEKEKSTAVAIAFTLAAARNMHTARVDVYKPHEIGDTPVSESFVLIRH
jgi:transposase-like protein